MKKTSHRRILIKSQAHCFRGRVSTCFLVSCPGSFHLSFFKVRQPQVNLLIIVLYMYWAKKSKKGCGQWCSPHCSRPLFVLPKFKKLFCRAFFVRVVQQHLLHRLLPWRGPTTPNDSCKGFSKTGLLMEVFSRQSWRLQIFDKNLNEKFIQNLMNYSSWNSVICLLQILEHF